MDSVRQSMRAANSRATALQERRHRAATAICRLSLETRRWRRDLLADWMTGTGRFPTLKLYGVGETLLL